MVLWSNGKQKDTNLTKVIVEGATQLANFWAAGDLERYHHLPGDG